MSRQGRTLLRLEELVWWGRSAISARPLSCLVPLAALVLLSGTPDRLDGQEGGDAVSADDVDPGAWLVASGSLGGATDLDDGSFTPLAAVGWGLEARLSRRLGLRGDLRLLLAFGGGGLVLAEGPAAVMYLGDHAPGGPHLRGGPMLRFGGGRADPPLSVPGAFVAFAAPIGGNLRLDLSASLMSGDGLLLEVGVDLLLR